MNCPVEDCVSIESKMVEAGIMPPTSPLSIDILSLKFNVRETEEDAEEDIEALFIKKTP